MPDCMEMGVLVWGCGDDAIQLKEISQALHLCEREKQCTLMNIQINEL